MTEKNQKYLVYGLVALGVISIGVMIYFRKKIMLFARDYVSKSLYAKANKEKLAEAHPAYKQKFINFMLDLEKHGYTVLITSLYRSFAKQEQLHKVNPDNAPAGTSLHNYGIAMDINIMKPKFIGMQQSDVDWKPIIEIAKKHGLKWGGGGAFGSYNDRVHFQPEDMKMKGSQLLALKNAGKVDGRGYVKLAS